MPEQWAGHMTRRLRGAGASEQSSNQVMMVAPTAFTFNEQAAQDNAFMHSSAAASGGAPETSAGDVAHPAPAAAAEVTRRVLQEHRGLHEQLTQVRSCVMSCSGQRIHAQQRSTIWSSARNQCWGQHASCTSGCRRG